MSLVPTANASGGRSAKQAEGPQRWRATKGRPVASSQGCLCLPGGCAGQAKLGGAGQGRVLALRTGFLEGCKKQKAKPRPGSPVLGWELSSRNGRTTRCC